MKGDDESPRATVRNSLNKSSLSPKRKSNERIQLLRAETFMTVEESAKEIDAKNKESDEAHKSAVGVTS